jgi:hypothetical protein
VAHYPVSSVPAQASRHRCECGCGEYTLLAKKSSGNHSQKKGEPRRFVSGHQSRIQRDLKYARMPQFIDPCDADLLVSNYYSVREKDGRYYLQRGGSGPNRMLHRDIGARIAGRPLKSRDIVDHRNGDGLDNRRRNLRVVTTSINLQNRIGLDGKNTSGYRGVSWCGRSKTWRAAAMVEGRTTIIGYFGTAMEAHAAAVAWRTQNMPGYINHEVAG